METENHLRRLRKARKITIAKLAELMNTTSTAIVYWEVRNIPSPRLRPLSEILDCTIEELLGLPPPTENISFVYVAAQAAIHQCEKAGHLRLEKIDSDTLAHLISKHTAKLQADSSRSTRELAAQVLEIGKK